MILITVLSILGFLTVLCGAILSYRGRIKEDPPGSGLFPVPSGHLSAMWITIAGGALGLAAALVGLGLG
jgi:hypothetical protein